MITVKQVSCLLVNAVNRYFKLHTLRYDMFKSTETPGKPPNHDSLNQVKLIKIIC